MTNRLLGVLFVITSMFAVMKVSAEATYSTTSPALVLGFLLLTAYGFGWVVGQFYLPRITGYMLAGLVFGPYFLSFFSENDMLRLDFLNSLALSFIAFCAGGELKLSNISGRLKSILYLVSFSALLVFVGVTATVFIISPYIPFMSDSSTTIRLAISSIFGVISVARSPSSLIAIISETKAKGVYTDTILSVTVAMDVVIIMMFGIVISFCQAIISSHASIDLTFFLMLLLEIIIAFTFGFFLGKAIIFLIKKVQVEFPIVIIGVGFLVIKFSHLLGDTLHEAYGIGLNLEPLLICMAAGFTVQNYSKHGKAFLIKMDRVSLPIYVAFFALTGASINIAVLKTGWLVGLAVVVSRIAMLICSSFLAGRLAGDSPKMYKNTWLGLITQAGVALGLLTEVVRRFPETGQSIQTILIASITVNQLLGPIALKTVLSKLGETNVRTER
jgi:Kef-type K+ transport system membrane component KefB